jgi:hypothetical protein
VFGPYSRRRSCDMRVQTSLSGKRSIKSLIGRKKSSSAHRRSCPKIRLQSLFVGCQIRHFCGAKKRPPNPSDMMHARLAAVRPQSTNGMVAHMTCFCEENLRLKRRGVKGWSRTSNIPEHNGSCCRVWSKKETCRTLNVVAEVAKSEGFAWREIDNNV